jgi:hypothetical protein
LFPPTDDPTLFSCVGGGCSGDCDDNDAIDSVDAVLEPTATVVVVWTMMTGVVVGIDISDLAVAISTEEKDTGTKANNNKLA